jgi:hypothetical protein
MLRTNREEREGERENRVINGSYIVCVDFL